jgi:Ca-activated chloride channel homolog
MFARPLAAALLLLGALVDARPGLGQPLPPVAQPLGTSATFRSSVDLVTLAVTVTDGKDRHVPGLVQSDFEVLEDGVPQQVSYFAANQLPLDVALLIDTSSSMREKLPLVHEAASRLVRSLKPGDRAEVVGFSSQTRILQPFTTDLELAQQAVKQAVARGGTALYTAIYVALDQLTRGRAQETADLRRPAIVVLTDGKDTSSLIQFDDVLERARRAGVAIYAISLVSPSDTSEGDSSAGRRFLDDSDLALKTLARETGGRSFFPREVAELNGVYESVAGELSTQYALGYEPKSAREDGAYHHLLVRVVSRPDARPRTRTGYYSPRAAAALR